MKIKELQKVSLEEGFIDNLIAKVKNMAGEDGPTGVVRALMGNNAALNKFADTIANTATPKITQRLGNQLNAIKNASTPVPLSMIYKQVMQVGIQLAAKDNNEVTATEIQGTIRANKDAVLKMLLNGSVADDNRVRDIFQAILTNSATIDGDFDVTIKTVSLIVAGTIIFIQTEKEDSDSETSLDAGLKTKFEQEGEQFNKEVLDPTTGIFKTLNPNEKFKDNMETVIVQLVKTIQDKYLPMPTDKLTSLTTAVPPLFSPVQLKTLIASHDNALDATAIATAQDKITALLQAQFTTWLALAAKESTNGRKADHSFDLYREWAKSALGLIDNMNISGTQSSAPGTKPSDPAVEDAFEKAHDAGEAARRRVVPNTGESNEDFINRANAEYEQARVDYLKAHTPP